MSNLVSIILPNSLIPEIHLRMIEATASSGGITTVIVPPTPNIPSSAFWELMDRITYALNATPDYENIRPPEINNHRFVAFHAPSRTPQYHPKWDYPNTRGDHVLASGATIDRTLIDNTGTVVDKMMREMRALGLLTLDDLAAARDMLKAQGLEPAPHGDYYKEGQEDVPTHAVSGKGLTPETRTFLKKVAATGNKRLTGVGQSLGQSMDLSKA